MRINGKTAMAAGLLAVLSTAAVPQQPRQQSVSRPAPRRPAAITVDEATLMTNGWAFLTEGRAAQAAARGDQALAAHPRSIAALTLAVEAYLARDGATGGLDRYERWLRERPMEEPAVLRRLAFALLNEEALQQQDIPARTEALLALANDGDSAALAEVQRGAAGAASTRAFASAGDERAVKNLIADLNRGSGDPVRNIDALGDSGDRAAAGAIVKYLGDPRQEVRGAAVAALGKLGDPRVAPQLTPLLSDRSAWVRSRAAGALLALGDTRGLQMLQQLLLDESPSVRLEAAEAMSSHPDGSWLSVVRQLSADPDAEIRLGAARLLAPHDADAARAVLEPLTTSDNPAIRDFASRGLADVLTNDLTALRRMLRNAQRLARVRAAARVLVLTR